MTRRIRPDFRDLTIPFEESMTMERHSLRLRRLLGGYSIVNIGQPDRHPCLSPPAARVTYGSIK